MNQLQDDWNSAWGSEYTNEYEYYGDDYDDWNYGAGLGSIMMMLERGKNNDNKDDKTTRSIIIIIATDDAKHKVKVGQQDLLMNSKRTTFVQLHNTFPILTDENDSDSEEASEGHASDTTADDCGEHETKRHKHKPNKRQRQRQKEMLHIHTANNTIDTERKLKDRKSEDRETLENWRRMSEN